MHSTAMSESYVAHPLDLPKGLPCSLTQLYNRLNVVYHERECGLQTAAKQRHLFLSDLLIHI